MSGIRGNATEGKAFLPDFLILSIFLLLSVGCSNTSDGSQWVVETGNPILTSPALDSQENIITSGLYGEISSISPSKMALNWSITLDDFSGENERTVLPPVIDEYDNICIVTEDADIFLLTKDGNLKWSMLSLPYKLYQPPFINQDFVYILDGDGIIYQLDSENGQLMRTRQLLNDEGDNVLFFKLAGQQLFALVYESDTDQITLFSFDLLLNVLLENAMDAADFERARSGYLLAIPDGDEIIVFTGTSFDRYVRIDKNGGSTTTLLTRSVLAGSNGVFRLDYPNFLVSTDEIISVSYIKFTKWSLAGELLADKQLVDDSADIFNLTREQVSLHRSGVLANDNYVYFLSRIGGKISILQINIESEERKILYNLEEEVQYSSLLILSDGLLVVCATNGNVKAFPIDSSRLDPNHILPMFRKDPQNRGW